MAASAKIGHQAILPMVPTLTKTAIRLIMEGSFHERNKQIFDRLVMVFGRIPNRMNIRLAKLGSPGFTVHTFAQRQKMRNAEVSQQWRPVLFRGAQERFDPPTDYIQERANLYWQSVV